MRLTNRHVIIGVVLRNKLGELIVLPRDEVIDLNNHFNATLLVDKFYEKYKKGSIPFEFRYCFCIDKRETNGEFEIIKVIEFRVLELNEMQHIIEEHRKLIDVIIYDELIKNLLQ